MANAGAIESVSARVSIGVAVSVALESPVAVATGVSVGELKFSVLSQEAVTSTPSSARAERRNGKAMARIIVQSLFRNTVVRHAHQARGQRAARPQRWLVVRGSPDAQGLRTLTAHADEQLF